MISLSRARSARALSHGGKSADCLSESFFRGNRHSLRILTQFPESALCRFIRIKALDKYYVSLYIVCISTRTCIDPYMALTVNSRRRECHKALGPHYPARNPTGWGECGPFLFQGESCKKNYENHITRLYPPLYVMTSRYHRTQNFFMAR